MGIAIPRDVESWASGMAAAKKGRIARTKEREKYMSDWKRSGANEWKNKTGRPWGTCAMR
jgi:hypothetical protein